MGAFLHSLAAAATMGFGWRLGFLNVAFVLNLLLWPLRELWQKIGRGHPLRDFFTLHVILEWGCPTVTALLIYVLI